MTDFDPEFDKLPDQPVTIGGDKSAAAWHPNSGPEVPHAELIARLRTESIGASRHSGLRFLVGEAADALAALGDTVPREQHEMMVRRGDGYKRAHNERTVECDALAHVIEQVREWTAIAPAWNLLSPEGAKAVVRIIDHAPVSLALHDAEVKAQALEEIANELESNWVEQVSVDMVRDRAAAIRAEAK